ncbi:hypothetical protein EVAR_54037_1 [Eumeta japonica]|uniref:Uncharacterized protein n=1 Tax=Eumeta variegata TaxID=151549 RepID=A0A4C1YSN5_EUMVA|nr:hypothetical protein EVAR_54037_1 [Eumeta japonica]
MTSRTASSVVQKGRRRSVSQILWRRRMRDVFTCSYEENVAVAMRGAAIVSFFNISGPSTNSMRKMKLFTSRVNSAMKWEHGAKMADRRRWRRDKAVSRCIMFTLRLAPPAFHLETPTRAVGERLRARACP